MFRLFLFTDGFTPVLNTCIPIPNICVKMQQWYNLEDRPFDFTWYHLAVQPSLPSLGIERYRRILSIQLHKQSSYQKILTRRYCLNIHYSISKHSAWNLLVHSSRIFPPNYQILDEAEPRVTLLLFSPTIFQK